MTPNPFDSPTPKRAPWGLIVLLSAVALGVTGFFGLYVVRPRLILRDFAAFLERHAIGSDIQAVAEDPFVDSATIVSVHGKPLFAFEKPSRDALRREFSERATGDVDIMWTHTPPFGRVSATLRYTDGRVVDVKTHDLD